MMTSSSILLLPILSVLLFGSSLAIPLDTKNISGRNQPRIVNGTATTIEEIPFQVSLQFYQSHTCGGAILTQDTIITAAHCLDFINEIHNISTLSVRIGSTYLQRDGEVHTLSQVIPHESYNPNNYDYDIALLKLSTPITFSESTRPVKFATMRSELSGYEMVQVSGWGRLRTGGPLADVLQKIEMPVLEQAECEEIFGRINQITERMFCAGYLKGEGDSCNGDSGGPLVDNNNVLYGLVSWGPAQCAIQGYTGVYTNVAYFNEWIVSHL